MKKCIPVFFAVVFSCTLSLISVVLVFASAVIYTLTDDNQVWASAGH